MSGAFHPTFDELPRTLPIWSLAVALVLMLLIAAIVALMMLLSRFGP